MRFLNTFGEAMNDTPPETGNAPPRWSKLYSLRMRHNYTQQYVADALGVSPATLGRWEKEPEKMHMGDLRKAAEFYKVSTEWLMSPDPLVLHMHDNQVANGAYNTVYMVSQDVWVRIDKCLDESARTNAELLRLNKRLMDVVEQLAGADSA